MPLATLIALAAQQTSATCPTPAPLPAGLAGWARPTTISAGARAAKAPTIAVGAATTAGLVPMATLTTAAAPAKAPTGGSHGGLLAFTIPAAGRYQVALGAAAWLDVIAGGKALASVAHGHGPACTGIRKIVHFDLKPGRYLLQIAGSPSATAEVLIARGG